MSCGPRLDPIGEHRVHPSHRPRTAPSHRGQSLPGREGLRADLRASVASGATVVSPNHHENRQPSMNLNLFKLIAAGIGAAMAGNIPGKQTGSRARGSAHPHRNPRGWRAKCRRLRKLQREARRIQRGR